MDSDTNEGGTKAKDAELKYDKEDVRRQIEEAYIDQDGKSAGDDEEDDTNIDYGDETEDDDEQTRQTH